MIKRRKPRIFRLGGDVQIELISNQQEDEDEDEDGGDDDEHVDDEHLHHRNVAESGPMLLDLESFSGRLVVSRISGSSTTSNGAISSNDDDAASSANVTTSEEIVYRREDDPSPGGGGEEETNNVSLTAVPSAGANGEGAPSSVSNGTPPPLPQSPSPPPPLEKATTFSGATSSSDTAHEEEEEDEDKKKSSTSSSLTGTKVVDGVVGRLLSKSAVLRHSPFSSRSGSTSEDYDAVNPSLLKKSGTDKAATSGNKTSTWDRLRVIMDVQNHVPERVREKRALSRQRSSMAEETPVSPLHQICAKPVVTLDELLVVLETCGHDAVCTSDSHGRLPLHILGDNDVLLQDAVGRDIASAMCLTLMKA